MIDSSTSSPFLFSIILQEYCDDVHSNRDWLFIICRFLKMQLKYLHQIINYTQYCNIIKLSIFLHISLHFKCSIKILFMSHNLKMLSFWSYYILHIKKKKVYTDFNNKFTEVDIIKTLNILSTTYLSQLVYQYLN